MIPSKALSKVKRDLVTMEKKLELYTGNSFNRNDQRMKTRIRKFTFKFLIAYTYKIYLKKSKFNLGLYNIHEQTNKLGHLEKMFDCFSIKLYYKGRLDRRKFYF